MSLDEKAVQRKGSPEWWMTTLAAKLLDRNRIQRLAILDAYRSGQPPLVGVHPSARKAFYEFVHITRVNAARVVVRAPGERMSVRAIRTAAADDENGDTVAWRYWTGAGMDVAETDAYSNMLTFAEGYVRVAEGKDRPVAFSCDPWSTIVVPDPLNPLVPKAAFYLVWDEWAQQDYAYLWLPGEQWVASAPRSSPPPRVRVAGTHVPRAAGRWRWAGIPRMSFSAGQFTMRPLRPGPDDDASEFEDDGGPYSEIYAQKVVPVVPYVNRDCVGEFEEHLDTLDRINHSLMIRVVIAAVQAFKQRALEQKDTLDGEDRMPDEDPNTGEKIPWDELFMPGPDALWKLPPGVTIRELSEAQMQGIITASQEDFKHLSSTTSTPFSLFSPDGVNQSAEGAQLTREGLVFKVEDRDKIAGRSNARVEALLLQFGDAADRYIGEGAGRVDRADPARIVFDWAPAERFSLAERAGADSQNKSLSADMAAAKIWGLTPEEVAINRAQRAADAMLASIAPTTPGQQLDSSLNSLRQRTEQQPQQQPAPNGAQPQPELVNSGGGTA